jgi:integrase/recombinase XerD
LEFYKNACYFAVRKGKISEFGLAAYRTARDQNKKPVYLSMKEVEKLLATEFDSAVLNRIKDVFLFQIGSGLAYCDLYGNWQITTIKGKTILTGTRQKNGQDFFVPLSDFAIDILKKYDYKLPKIRQCVLQS